MGAHIKGKIMLEYQWNDMDEMSLREAQALTTVTVTMIRQRASHVTRQELRRGLERLAIVNGDIEAFVEAA
jgi:hypothetical protein